MSKIAMMGQIHKDGWKILKQKNYDVFEITDFSKMHHICCCWQIEYRASGSPHGTGGRISAQLQMSVVTGIDELTSSTRLHAPAWTLKKQKMNALQIKFQKF